MAFVIDLQRQSSPTMLALLGYFYYQLRNRKLLCYTPQLHFYGTQLVTSERVRYMKILAMALAILNTNFTSRCGCIVPDICNDVNRVRLALYLIISKSSDLTWLA